MTLEFDRRYIIGIDLGTTNCAVAYAEMGQGVVPAKDIKLFRVPQLTGPGEFTGLPVLPSFLYIPGEFDISPEAISIPWEKTREGGAEEKNPFVGAFARDHGAKVPSRLVSSAKSWLCHGNVDRRARILPWGAGGEIYRVSPVQATAAYLDHIRRAWNHARQDEEEAHLENQMVVVTVPASFDEVARDLTLEAAEMAGLRNITLIEEPLAAFYSWLIRHEGNWSDFVKPGELILVCDVGGGTTDFTLITLREAAGSPRFERIAVGDHLILGGDNVDLALARRVETRFAGKRQSLSADRWKALCHQCRQAKEQILSGEAESRRITLMGEGSRLIAGTLSAVLDRADVLDVVLEGFFPLVDPGPAQKSAARKGITEFGLPYEPEPAVTRHLGWFLERHREDVKNFLNRDQYAPDWILFNGGSLKPSAIQGRIRAAARKWFKEEDTLLPRVLENPDPDLAVALGAAYYGLVKTGKGVRVGSGSPRSFYLGVSRAGGAEAGPLAVCLVERGLDEGTLIRLEEKKFEVLTNQPVSFDLYSSSFRSGDRLGDVIVIDDTLSSLPPLQTVVQYGKKGAKTAIPVQVEGEYTELGTLAVWCRSLVGSHRWRLQFQLRDAGTADVAEREVFESALVEEARTKVREALTDPSGGGSLEALVKEVARTVERPREKWSLGFIRSLADELLDLLSARNLSAEHESRWMNLAGFCMRPGFGDGLDEHRMKQLWKIYRQGPVFGNQPQVRMEWWILWRRVAAGLTSGQQRQFIQDLTPVMMPRKGEKARIPPQEAMEIWMAVANMERLLVKDKIVWGKALLSEIRPKKSKPQHLWALSRIGARELLYGPADRVIPPGEASAWIDVLLSLSFRNPKPLCAALAQLARKTGDRVRDLEPAVKERVREWMAAQDGCGSYLRYLKEVVAVEKGEEAAIFGESLPSGLVLHG